MKLIYLEAVEYESFAIDPRTPAALVASASALMDAHCRRESLGVTEYSERVRLAAGRSTVRLTYLPLATVAPAVSPFVSVRARFAQPRRGEGAAEISAEVARAFGLPGQWTTLDPITLDYFAETGEVTLQQHPLGLPFNEMEVKYTAGLATIPDAVKHACAGIVRNAQANPSLNVKRGGLDKISLEYFSDSLLDDSVRRLLRPYVAVAAR